MYCISFENDSHSLSIEKWLDIGHHVVGVDAMSKELDELTLAIEQVLGEVPSDLAVRRLCLQVLVEGRSVVTLDVYFAQ